MVLGPTLVCGNHAALIIGNAVIAKDKNAADLSPDLNPRAEREPIAVNHLAEQPDQGGACSSESSSVLIPDTW